MCMINNCRKNFGLGIAFTMRVMHIMCLHTGWKFVIVATAQNRGKIHPSIRKL